MKNLYAKAVEYLKAHGFSEATIKSLGFSGVIVLYLTLIVAGALLMVGWFVISTLGNALSTSGFTTKQNATNASLQNNIASAFLLGGIGLIALGAGGVIYSLTSSFGFGTKQ